VGVGFKTVSLVGFSNSVLQAHAGLSFVSEIIEVSANAEHYTGAVVVIIRE
jgi:hypothetical protein